MSGETRHTAQSWDSGDSFKTRDENLHKKHGPRLSHQMLHCCTNKHTHAVLNCQIPSNRNWVICIAPPNEDRERITKQSSVGFPVSADRLEQNVFSWRWKVFVDRSRSSTVSSLFLTCGAATEKALLPIRNQISPIIQRVTTQKSYMAACSLLLVARLYSDV